MHNLTRLFVVRVCARPQQAAMLDDLPAAALRLITRAARTRHIPGTNRYARVFRRWRDASMDSDAQEQLQLLLALEVLPPDAVASTCQWLAQHGACVTFLDISYNASTVALLQQLPLSTAPLVGLARLEVDGPDSLVALAPALPQLVALTHLRACVEVVGTGSITQMVGQGVFGARGVPLEAPPVLRQLCPGLKSLHLDVDVTNPYSSVWVEAPVMQLLPAHLEQLHIQGGDGGAALVRCTALTPLTSLRHLALHSLHVVDPDLLLDMPGVEQLEMTYISCFQDDEVHSHFLATHWGTPGRCSAPQHLTKLVGLTTADTDAGTFIPAPLLTLVPGLRKLEVFVWGAGVAASLEQLSALNHLQHLSLTFAAYRDSYYAATVLSGLTTAPHLTCLCVCTSSAEVPRSTWARLLPCLTQLRVLVVTQENLLGQGLAAEVHQLKQLQCLYVGVRGPSWSSPIPAATCAAVAPHLQLLSECKSLRAVLCWYVGESPAAAAPCLWEHEGRLHLSCWHLWRQAAEEGRVVLPRRCPHLPGVWELLQQQQQQ